MVCWFAHLQVFVPAEAGGAAATGAAGGAGSNSSSSGGGGSGSSSMLFHCAADSTYGVCRTAASSSGASGNAGSAGGMIGTADILAQSGVAVDASRCVAVMACAAVVLHLVAYRCLRRDILKADD
jgi:hypothetical protein